MRDAAAYAEQLQQLLPPGPAWPRSTDSVLGRLLRAIAEELARIDGRAFALVEEADPRTALELLPDWERVAGLPDECVPIPGGVRERQIAAARKITGIGGQSIAFFEELGAQLGIEIDIQEFAPFVAGSYAGDEVRDDSWRHVFRIRVLPPSESSGGSPTLRFAYFSAGQSNAGDLLSSVNAEELECVVRRAAPAHAVTLFAYPQDPEPLLWFDFI
jgi:uncharacterized protein YmfQ (DUF2313 family)